VHGKREWRIGRVAEPRLDAAAPLKILTNFVAEHTWTLVPGDMLYLPPLWAHDGVARGECMTCSIGFRAPSRRSLARDVLQRLLDVEPGSGVDALYRDAQQPATYAPARLPSGLVEFAAKAVVRELSDVRRLSAAVGELMSEPKDNVVFDAGLDLTPGRAVRLDCRTRMVYDAHHVFINGDSYLASGRDASLLRQLADRRELSGENLEKMSHSARSLVHEWVLCGWLREA
jgi:50S ribosomal protein L16 3-hydroxylase